MTLATINAPNLYQDTFLCKIHTKLVEVAEGKLILGGDFNIPLAPGVDTFSCTSLVPPCSWKRVLQTLHELQLVDAWRILQFWGAKL